MHTGQKQCALSQLASLAGLILGLAKGQKQFSSHIHPWQLTLWREMLHQETLLLWLPLQGKASVSRAQQSSGKEIVQKNFIGLLFFISFFAPFWFHLGEGNKDRDILFKKSSRRIPKKIISTANSSHEQPKGCD